MFQASQNNSPVAGRQSQEAQVGEEQKETRQAGHFRRNGRCHHKRNSGRQGQAGQRKSSKERKWPATC